MITTLSVKVPEKQKGLKKYTELFKKDRIDVQIRKARGVRVKQITYTSYSGKLRLDKADKVIGAQRNHLLCSELIKLPPKSGYKRFYSTLFSARLCVNMAIAVIRNI